MPSGQTHESDQIYFIEATESSRIKIGTSKRPIKRLYALRHICSEMLEILFYVEGTRDMEQWVHAKFAHLRLHGEWFEPGADLIAFMTELWQRHQAHRASFMGYGRERFFEILQRGGYTWRDLTYINGALYRQGRLVSGRYGHERVIYNSAALAEFASARLPEEPLPTERRQLFTPKELEVWDHVLSTT